MPLMKRIKDRIRSSYMGDERTFSKYLGTVQPEEAHLQTDNSLTAIYFSLFKDAMEVLELQLRLTRKLPPFFRISINYHHNPLLVLSIPIPRKITATPLKRTENIVYFASRRHCSAPKLLRSTS
jgi:hypothetical protein